MMLGVVKMQRIIKRTKINKKLTEKQVYLIYNACYTSAFTYQELANTFNVSVSCIRAIANKKTWKHLWH